MLSFLTSPTFFCFHLLQKSFPNSSLASPPLFLFFVLLFRYCISNWSSQWQRLCWPTRRANKSGPQENNTACCPCVPSLSHLWPADQLTGTCWSINKHIYLTAVSWRESYCNPHTDKVISQDWLIRGVLLRQVDNPLSLCYTSFSWCPGFALIQVAGTNKVLCTSFPLAASHHLGAFRLGDQSNWSKLKSLKPIQHGRKETQHQLLAFLIYLCSTSSLANTDILKISALSSESITHSGQGMYPLTSSFYTLLQLEFQTHPLPSVSNSSMLPLA